MGCRSRNVELTSTHWITARYLTVFDIRLSYIINEAIVRDLIRKKVTRSDKYVDHHKKLDHVFLYTGG